MNILVFSWRDPKHPLSGGAEQVMHEHMKGWAAAGHKVVLFSSYFKGGKKKEKIDNIIIVRRGYQYIGVQVAAFFYYLKNADKYDFIVDQFHGLPFFTPIYSRKPKLAVLQEVARRVWLLNPLPFPMNWIVGVIGFLGDPFIFLPYKNTHFMTGSKSAKDDLIKYGVRAENITIVPHGVLIEKPSRDVLKEKAKTIIFLGVLSKDKGIEDAILCFEFLNGKGVYNYWVVGKPETKEYARRIEDLVKRKGLNVKFWGFVSQKKKFELLKRAHVLINPSVHEGWGLVNIEANSMGTPVASYRSQGLVDSVKENHSGLICKSNTPEDLAKTALLILKQSNYQRLKEGALEWSSHFSWEKSKKRSLSLLDSIRK